MCSPISWKTNSNLIKHPAIMNIPAVFDSIRPYEPSELPAVYDRLLSDSQFQKVVAFVMPGHDINQVAAMMHACKDNLQFQRTFCYTFLEQLLSKASTGCDMDCEAIDIAQRYTFVSNHRDIVLDAALLDKLLIDAQCTTTTEIAIGDNLLTLPWVKDLARVNKSFIVERSLSPRQMLVASKRLSEYMHFAVKEKHENLWIAQREGRAKDSDDRTQPAILKMMAMGGEGDALQRLLALHIVPLAISYEYDPCDYLKAAELQRRRDEEHFQKLPGEDVLSMQTGIMGYKGKIHYHAAKCIDEFLLSLPADTPRTELFDMVAEHIDREIHRHYRIYANNYVALDMLRGDGANSNHYSAQERKNFEGYIEQQLQKIQLAQPDWTFLRQQMLLMYANPLINHLNTLP